MDNFFNKEIRYICPLKKMKDRKLKPQRHDYKIYEIKLKSSLISWYHVINKNQFNPISLVSFLPLGYNFQILK